MAEYNKYNNWQASKTQLEEAEAGIAEANEELPDAQEELALAEQDIEWANDMYEYDAAKARFDAATEALATLNEKLSLAQEVYDNLVDEVPTLESDFDTAKTKREESKKYLEDNVTDLTLEEYDVTAGDAPPLPEEADAASADDTAADDSAADDSSPVQGEGR